MRGSSPWPRMQPYWGYWTFLSVTVLALDHQVEIYILAGLYDRAHAGCPLDMFYAVYGRVRTAGYGHIRRSGAHFGKAHYLLAAATVGLHPRTVFKVLAWRAPQESLAALEIPSLSACPIGSSCPSCLERKSAIATCSYICCSPSPTSSAISSVSDGALHPYLDNVIARDWRSRDHGQAVRHKTTGWAESRGDRRGRDASDRFGLANMRERLPFVLGGRAVDGCVQRLPSPRPRPTGKRSCRQGPFTCQY